MKEAPGEPNPRIATGPSPSRPGFTCLLVDDDLDYAALLARLVRDGGGTPHHTTSLAAARQELDRRTYDVVILDNRLPDGTGYEFFPHVALRCPTAPILMITGAPELSQAIELTRNGLFDYMTKPLDADAFTACLERVKRRLARGPQLAQGHEMIGSSAAIGSVVQSLQQAARHPTTTVLLLGETGTGKDLAARLLHQWTYEGRARMPEYVAVNCGSVPAEMFEAELFGSEKGAFTGSDRRRAGLVEAADGGTLFLDEIGDLSMASQVKLLRLLQEREYYAIGADTPQYTDARIIVATHRDIADLQRAPDFRKDLLYRLRTYHAHVPPLRERAGDLPLLLSFFVTQAAEAMNKPRPDIAREVFAALGRHDFPGNVRELRAMAFDAVTLCKGSRLEVSNFHRMGLDGGSPPHPHEDDSPTGVRFGDPLPTLKLCANLLVEEAMRRADGNQATAAAMLGITRQALNSRLRHAADAVRDGDHE